MDYEEKQIIRKMAKDIRDTYQFSLCVPEANYKPIEKIAEMMGGGIEYSKSIWQPYVARCGNGFLARIPAGKSESPAKMRFSFAEALGILFLGMKYRIDDSFYDHPNMGFHSMDGFARMGSPEYFWMMELAQELYLPAGYLRSVAEKHCDADRGFSLTAVAEELSVDRDYLERRMIRLEMIKR